MLPWLLCGVLTAVIATLLVKLWLLRRSLDEIVGQLEGRLSQDTNNPIFLSTRDGHARRLAAELNIRLKELRRQRQRYENGDQALKEAVTNVSHDLRTPLTAICGYLELLERRDTDPDTARYLSLIGDRADAMKQLTEELLRYSVARSAGEVLTLEEADLNAALESCVAAFYGALTGRGIIPAVSIPKRHVTRRLDRAALSRILDNLMSNALKYSGGDLEITLTEDGAISFRNSAPSLTEVQAGRLFDRFFTVEAARSSTGLGLSIVKTLAERMGGRISAQYKTGYLEITVCFDP